MLAAGAVLTSCRGSWRNVAECPPEDRSDYGDGGPSGVVDSMLVGVGYLEEVCPIRILSGVGSPATLQHSLQLWGVEVHLCDHVFA
jgi:hypothetical protein